MNDGSVPLSPELTALDEYFTDHGLDVHPTDDGQSLIIEKVDVTYHLQPEHVEGDRTHHKQLEHFLSD